jgi:hypothetical protein
MRLIIDNSTRFFSVVGAPYIAERHSDACGEDLELLTPDRPAHLCSLPRPCTTGSWLQDDR